MGMGGGGGNSWGKCMLILIRYVCMLGAGKEERGLQAIYRWVER